MHVIQLMLLLAVAVSWQLFRAICVRVQRLWWTVSGTSRTLRESELPENYERSAQLLKIIGRYKFDDVYPVSSASDFLTMHEGFDTAQRVLQDHVSLYKVTDTEALFVETTPGRELWRSKYSPMFLTAQFMHAVRVIRMPLSSFRRVSGQLPDPANLTFISTTGRSGSTLLAKMFEVTGQVIVYSEPTVLTVTHRLLAEETDSADAELRTLILDTVRVLCKKTSLGERGYVIKLPPTVTRHVAKLTSIFPNAHWLFLYRDGLTVTRSMYRLAETLPLAKLTFLIFATPWLRSSVFSRLAGFQPVAEGRPPVTSTLTVGAIQWLESVRHYRELRDSGHPIVAIRYEDIVADSESSMRRILHFCGLPEHLAEGSVDALKADAQLNTAISSEALRHHAVPQYCGTLRDEIDRMCEFHHLPPFSRGEKYIVPGTITSSGL